MEVDDQDVQNTSCRIDSFGNDYTFPYQFNSSLCDRMTMIINNFFQRNQMTENYSEVLRYVSIFSANSNSEELANAIQSTIQSNVNRIMDDLTMNYLQNDDTSFMNYMAENWLKFYGCIKKIRELIVFYDYSFYIPKLHQSFYSKCIDIWKDTFVSSTYARIQEKTYTSMLNYLYLQREQCSITPNETLLTIVKMLNEVQLYEQFEKKLISSQCDFYNELVDRMTDEQKPMEPSLYIQKFKECIAFETSISDQLLNHYSLLSLLNTIYYCFITLPSHYLFDYAVEILIEHQYFDELTTLYIYCEKLDTSSKLNLISRLKQATCQYITKKGNQIYKMNKNYTDLINSLLDLNQLMNRLNDCYHKNGTLSLSINDTMRSTISQEEHLVINSLVLYIHSMILQLPVLSSSKKSTNQFERNSKEKDLFFDQSVSTLEELKASIANDQFTDFIDQCVQIYTFIAKKDEFENIYKIYLSKRLLLFHSLHFSHEQYVITSLSKENTKCVQCLLTIMEDMKRSYKFTKEISISTYYPVNCTIVSKSIWSLYDDESKDGDVEMKEKVSIPEDQDISIYKTKFCKKYMQHYTNPETMKAERQIFISDYDSYYYISMKLNKKNYTFYTTFYQYFILSQFSKRPTYTYNELKSISNFSDSILQKALQPILYIKLLVTDDANITPNSKITFNSSFADNISEENKEMLIIRGVINLDCMNDSLFKFESNSDDDQTQITDTQINAAIVRLLKKVKEMSFDKIVNSLNEEFNTHLDVDQVKACIDHLITKECIEHKDNQPDILVYC